MDHITPSVGILLGRNVGQLQTAAVLPLSEPSFLAGKKIVPNNSGHGAACNLDCFFVFKADSSR